MTVKTEVVADAAELRTAEPKRTRGRTWLLVMAYGLLPGLAMLLALAAGYWKWQGSSVHDSDVDHISSTQAAKDGAIAMLSYRFDSAESELGAARDRLTGPLRDSYTALVNDVVVPGAQQRQISAVATVPAVASVSASAHHAVVLVFVNQSVVVGKDVPTDTTSAVRVTLDRVDDRWLISGFDPV